MVVQVRFIIQTTLLTFLLFSMKKILIDGGDLASEEMLAAVPGLLQKLKRAMEPAAFAHLWESLPPDSRKILYPVLEHS